MKISTQEQKQKAAILVAKNKLTNAEIAKQSGVSLRTISVWKTLPDFKELVRQAKDAWRIKAHTGGPDDPDRRALDYKVLRAKYWKAIQDRAADPNNAHIPGYNTGMMAVTYKKDSIEDPNDPEKRIPVLVPEYKLDDAPLNILAIDRQAAEDAGQWKTKKELVVTGPDNGPIQIENVSALTDDELRILIALARKLNGAGAGGGTQSPPAQPHPQPLSLDGPAAPGSVSEAP